MSARKRVFKALSANVFSQAILLSYRVVLPPLFLRAWGVEVYGDWLILSSVAIFFWVSDFGARFHLGNRLLEHYEKGETRELSRLLHTGFWLVLALPLALLVASAAALGIGNLVGKAFGLSRIPADAALGLYVILSLQQVASTAQAVLTAIYRAGKLLHRGIMMGNLTQGLQLVAVAGALYFKAAPAWVAFAQLAPCVLLALAAVVDLNRRFPGFRIGSLQGFDWTAVPEIARPSLQFFWIQLAQLATMQGLILLVGRLLDSAEVSLFATTRTLSSVVIQILAGLSVAVSPELTRLSLDQGARSRAKLLGVFRVAHRSTALAALGLAAILYHLGRPIFEGWTRGTLAFDPHLLGLFLLYVLQASCWTMHKAYLMSTNQQAVLSRSLLVSAVLMLAFSWALGSRFGLSGIVGGMILSETLVPFWVAPYLMRARLPELGMRAYVLDILPVVIGAVLIAHSPLGALAALAGTAIWWGLGLREFSALRRPSSGVPGTLPRQPEAP